MGRRKDHAPQKKTEEDRHVLSWNMLDQGQSSSASIIIDDNEEPTPLLEHGQVSLDVAGEVTLEDEDTGNFKQLQSYVKDVFSFHLNFCPFYVSVFDRLHAKDESWSFEVGRFELQVLFDPNCDDYLPLPNGCLPQCEECRLHVGESGHKSMLYFELEDSENFDILSEDEPEKKTLFRFVHASLPVECLRALEVKAFQVVRGMYNPASKVLELIIYAQESVLFSPKFPSEFIRPNKVSKAVSVLINHFYRIEPDFNFEGLLKTEKHDVDKLYEAVKECHMSREVTLPSVDVQHPCLKPVLRNYQKLAVRWMLNQEKYDISDDNQQSPDGQLHPLYAKVTMKDGQVLYYNKYNGILIQHRPVIQHWPPGGLLADEMGLGKTVEVLCCMLLHPRPGLKSHKEVSASEEIKPENNVMDSEMIDRDQQNKPDAAADESLESPDGFKYQMDAVFVDPVDSQDGNHKVADSVKHPDREDSPEMDTSTGDQGEKELTDTDGLDVREEASKTSMSPPGEEMYKDDVKISETVCTDEHIPDNMCDEAGVFASVGVEAFSVGCSVGSNEICLPSTSSSSTFASVKNCPSSQDPLDVDMTPSQSTDSPKEESCSLPVPSAMNVVQVSSDDEDLSEEVIKPVICSRKRKKKSLSFGKRKKRSSIRADLEKSIRKATPKTKKAESKFEVLVAEHEFQPATFFTDTDIKPKQWFECVCGGDHNDRWSRRKKLTPVECVQCGIWQHAECLHYDVNSPEGVYKCPHCHVSSIPIPSGATLIISPSSISEQWVEEINKHIKQDSLRLFVYHGVNKLGFIQPTTLADCDIVITTYETLRKEIDYVDLPHSNSSAGRRFRHRKRFMATPSPIIAVEWWRICLDEAQMVECTTTKTAEMALRLSGVNRWCVTGTPIQKSVQDLYGLLLFLGIDPYWVEMWWKRLLYVPFSYGITQPMYDTLSQVLWRTAKKDVLDQILLPPQTQSIHWLTFSPVEDHFYRRQYRDCVKEASKELSQWTDNSLKLSSMDRRTMSKLLHPLLKLRQACCHPQAVRGEFLPINKSTMTMEELLENLTKKAKTECEEAHRLLVAALNGLAAVNIIKDEYAEAVEKYRQVLRSVTEHEDRLRTDEMQQLHALHNLQEILTQKPAGVQPTLRDHQLKEQCDDLRKKYMVKVASKVSTALESLLPLQQTVIDTRQECEAGGDWWSELIGALTDRDLDEELVYRVKEDIESHGSGEGGISMASSFRDVNGLEYCMYTKLTAMTSVREKLAKAVKKVSEKPSLDVINQTVECCLRPVDDKPLGTCPFCKTDELFNAYESKLFSFREKGLMGVGDEDDVVHQVSTKRQGTWADSDVEKTLKSLIAFCRHHGVSHHEKVLLDVGAIQLKLLDAMKKEFKVLRTVWLVSHEQVASLDELDMATTRLRVRLPDEPKPETPQPNILERGEVDTHRLKFVADKANAEGELRRKLGQLLYLTNLAKSQSDNDGDGSNPDPCPICQRALGTEWCVLLCGHCYCLECIRFMVDRFSFGGRNRSLRCALCRQNTHHSDISYVSAKKNSDNDEEEKVTGSHSTKVEAIVSCIKKIQKEDPTAKTLVFSTWSDVLDVIGKALKQNDCVFTSLHEAGKFQKNLAKFKSDEKINTLLIPIHSGAKGLNLIEATHVLLVEPILNPAEELQAVGRVHRIGQTRPTFVHKFLVRGTIEQRINHMVKSMSSSATDDHTMTIGDLTDLFKEVITEETSVADDPVPSTSAASEESSQSPASNIKESKETSKTGMSAIHAPYPSECAQQNTISVTDDPVPSTSTASEESSQSPVSKETSKAGMSVIHPPYLSDCAQQNTVSVTEDPVPSTSAASEESSQSPASNIKESKETSKTGMSAIHAPYPSDCAQQNTVSVTEDPVPSTSAASEESSQSPASNIKESKETSKTGMSAIHAPYPSDCAQQNAVSVTEDPVPSTSTASEEYFESPESNMEVLSETCKTELFVTYTVDGGDSAQQNSTLVAEDPVSSSSGTFKGSSQLRTLNSDTACRAGSSLPNTSVPDDGAVPNADGSESQCDEVKEAGSDIDLGEDASGTGESDATLLATRTEVSHTVMQL